MIFENKSQIILLIVYLFYKIYLECSMLDNFNFNQINSFSVILEHVWICNSEIIMNNILEK